MKFSIFNSVRAQVGRQCTYEDFLQASSDPTVVMIHKEIAATDDKEKIAALKKKLPIITWQAFFEGKRLNKEAKPSGLYMLDIDHVDNPGELWSKLLPRWEELGIVFASITSSCHGLRLIAKCRPEFTTIPQCQKWLSEKLGVEFDEACKDWARSSYVVPESYHLFMDAGAIWQSEPEKGCVYHVETAYEPNTEMEEALNGNFNFDEDQREGLFGGPTDYKGIPYEKICQEWLRYTGGEPEQGERNVRLHRLAMHLRYITDFNAATMLRVMPRYGLSEDEMKTLISSALKANKGSEIPLDMQAALERCDREIKLAGGDEDIPEIITHTEKVPSLPPVLRQWYDVAPDDFKKPVTLCQLPILGALGSRLRAKYLDGKIHSPSFQVSLEAPQASGKSFMDKLVNYELAQMMQSDEDQRAIERAYQDEVAQLKLTNSKIKKEDLPKKPQGIIRFLPPTISITMLLKRMEGAQGLHCFAYSPEIDTVTRAFKRGFSNLSEVLRVSFDNGLYGQDFASENSWSGNVQLFYNCLFSGTPKAMRRFYPDVEDGLVSRVLFVTLADQFGKPMPVWREFNEKEKMAVDVALTRLNEISLQGSEVQKEHFMKMDFLNKALEKWIKSQQIEAVKEDDRTRDIFCRRAAVVGFRAGMLCYFLWGETPTPPIRKNTCDFAIWVANCMLNQHMLRFQMDNTSSNVNKWQSLYDKLPQEFKRADLEKEMIKEKIGSPFRTIIYKWSILGIIQKIETKENAKNSNKETIYKKVKQ